MIMIIFNGALSKSMQKAWMGKDFQQSVKE